MCEDVRDKLGSNSWISLDDLGDTPETVTMSRTNIAQDTGNEAEYIIAKAASAADEVMHDGITLALGMNAIGVDYVAARGIRHEMNTILAMEEAAHAAPAFTLVSNRNRS